MSENMLFGQTFSLLDIPRVAFLAILEILLSADNAIVLGLIVSRLPTALHKRALFIGTLSAWIFRLGAILAVSFLLTYPWIQLLGGLYLIYLSLCHLFPSKKKAPTSPTSFWKTVLLIEAFDLAFAVDSIVAGLAFVGSSGALLPKIWIVYIGGMIGLFAIRFAAKFFITLLKRFPRLEKTAYGMVGWIGLKLSVQSFSLHLPYTEFVFWTILALLFLTGLTKRRTHV
jgi:YkoY family integral membrane protein